MAGGPREEPAGLGHTSRAGVLFCLGFIESKWKCLHRLVTSLISKHGLIGGWSRGWGCQLYPQPWQGGVGEGRALLLIAHPSLSCSRGFCTAQPSWLAQLCAATSKIPKSSRAVPQSRCIFAHVGSSTDGCSAPHNFYPRKNLLDHPGPSPAHQGRTRLVPSVLGRAWSSLEEWKVSPWNGMSFDVPPNPNHGWFRDKWADFPSGSRAGIQSPGETQRAPAQPCSSSQTRPLLQEQIEDGLPGQATFPLLPSGPRRPSHVACGQHTAVNESTSYQSLAGNVLQLQPGHAAHATLPAPGQAQLHPSLSWAWGCCGRQI